MIARFQRFGGRVQRASSVAGIGARTRLKNVILELGVG